MGKEIKSRSRWGFPGLLRFMRTFRCFTQEEFASFIGIPYNTYRVYENGRSSPPIETLRKIAIALNVSVDWLLELSDSEDPDESRKQCIGTEELTLVRAKLQELDERRYDKKFHDRLEKENFTKEMQKLVSKFLQD